jgi:tRNA (cytidine/uridine-2'-O-)-methyltransferase
VFHVVLVEPEIPPNTGNVIRLCANTGAQLHLVEPLGFSLEDKQLRRAGLDYHEYATVKCHASFDALLRSECPAHDRMFAMTSRSPQRVGSITFNAGDWFVFGSETRGLSDEVRALFPENQRLRLPMVPGVRSLNLSNAVAVVVYEAWRQDGFSGAR